MDDSNFFSINSLVEFGMGMAVAQQMVKTMNHSMDNMKVPGSFSTQQPQSHFYAVIDEKQVGPLSEQDISQLIRDKKIVNETYMWKPSMPNWVIAEKMPEILRLVALCPPPLPSTIYHLTFKTMKINSVPLIISLSISGLIAFGFYSFLQGTSTSNSLLTTTIFSFVFSAVTLSNILSINFETERITTIIRTVSGVFFTIGLGTLILLLVLTNSMPILVIVIGIILLVFISIVYSIAKSGQ